MNLEQRIEILNSLGKYIKKNSEKWQIAKNKALIKNGWFTPEFVDLATDNIINEYLNTDKLTAWVQHYQIKHENPSPKTVGIVMAGNIPMVGFHDFLCVFITGNKQRIKLSSKDDVLMYAIVNILIELAPEVGDLVQFSDMLKDCDAYIATGSNNSGRYFELYFSKYPNIIRRNRSSVAVLTGTEQTSALESLVDDVQLYYGLGCRNVTQIYVPIGYDFVPLINAFKKNEYLLDYMKYKNNYDYQLAILLLNKEFYMSGGSIILRQADNIFAPLSVLNYALYDDKDALSDILNAQSDNIQCIVGQDFIPFGNAQNPTLFDYADGIDTMEFCKKL